MKTKVNKHLTQMLIAYTNLEAETRLLLLNDNLDKYSRKKVLKLLKLTEKVKDEITSANTSKQKDLIKKSSDFTQWFNNFLRIIEFFTRYY